MNLIHAAILIIGYIFLLGTSGRVLNFILSRISSKPLSQTVSKEVLDTGFIVGKCENLLILTFMFLGQYTALALVFAAKTIARREDMSRNSLFFLAGTMINVTYSIMIGLVLLLLIGII